MFFIYPFFYSFFPRYFIIKRSNSFENKDAFSVIWKSEVIKNTLNPVWNPFEVESSILCDNNPDHPLKVKNPNDKRTKTIYIKKEKTSTYECGDPRTSIFATKRLKFGIGTPSKSTKRLGNVR